MTSQTWTSWFVFGSGEIVESFKKQDDARWEYMLTNIIYTGMFGFSAYYFLTN